MKGYLRYNEDQVISATTFNKSISTQMGLPNGDTQCWDAVTAFCSYNPQTSGYTDFWGYCVKVDTEQMGEYMTEDEINAIIQIPDDIKICGG